jgi:uncharacterized membrane protein
MRIGRFIMGALYITAGALHFVLTRTYVGIMPDYLPAHRELVMRSGVAEIAGGIGVMVPQTKRAAGWGLVLLLVSVMPANIWMAQHPERYSNIPLWVIWLRLPLQLPLLWWAWRFTRPRAIRSSVEGESPAYKTTESVTGTTNSDVGCDPR